MSGSAAEHQSDERMSLKTLKVFVIIVGSVAILIFGTWGAERVGDAGSAWLNPPSMQLISGPDDGDGPGFTGG